MGEARSWIDFDHPELSVREQCRLLGLHRSNVYYDPVPESQENLRLMRMMDEEHLKRPFQFGTGWLGDFITRIRDAKPGEPLAVMTGQLQELIEINDYSKQYHHGTNESADHHPISETELKTFTK